MHFIGNERLILKITLLQHSLTPYFLIFVINLLKAYSQPYILMTLIPLMTSLINFTLVSVTFAALNLHKEDCNIMYKIIIILQHC